jgi:DNA-binding NarL/FixJ family response regulator
MTSDPPSFPGNVASSSSRIRVLVVDDHPLLREGIRAVIATAPDIEFAGEASNGLEAVERFRAIRPDVTLMDLQLPEMSGIDAMSAIRTEFPTARIIVLTTYDRHDLAKRALRAGAQGYVLKSSVRELLDAIRHVHTGAKQIEPEISTQIASHMGEEALSTREVQVITLIAAGCSNKTIATHLSITEETAKGYVKNIVAKLGADGRTHAVVLALRRGIIHV